MREFFRGPQWASPGARDTWRPILDKARRGWEELEPLSVSEGLRDSALFILSLRELVEATRGTVGQDLQITVLGESARAEGYSVNSPNVGTPGVRVAIHRNGLGPQWLKVWEEQDDEAIGTLLGFPPCCIDFFSRVWKTERRRDPTPFMEGLEAPGDPKGNILFRWLGVRLVPHMPCSFTCRETVRQATAMAKLGRDKGLGEEVTAIEQVLAQPVRYSSLHGVGIIETPSFRFAFSTDWGPTLRTFSREAVGGEDLDRTIRLEAPSQSASDNGFPSEELMDRSHLVVIQAVGVCTSALDLGCGDGTLLAKLTEGRAGRWTGVEMRAPVAHRGSKCYPLVRFVVGRMEEIVTQCPETLGEHEVILLMPGRLIELGAERAREVRQALKAVGRRLVIYAYGDWLHRYPGLEALTKEAGLPRLGQVFSNGLEAQAAEVLGGTAAIE